MAQFSDEITVNGLNNFGTLLIANGYRGGFGLSNCKIQNDSASVPLRIIQTADGVNAPANTAGVAIMADTVEFNSGNNDVALDAGTTWLYAASSIVVEIFISGGGI